MVLAFSHKQLPKHSYDDIGSDITIHPKPTGRPEKYAYPSSENLPKFHSRL